MENQFEQLTIGADFVSARLPVQNDTVFGILYLNTIEPWVLYGQHWITLTQADWDRGYVTVRIDNLIPDTEYSLLGSAVAHTGDFNTARVVVRTLPPPLPEFADANRPSWSINALEPDENAGIYNSTRVEE